MKRKTIKLLFVISIIISIGTIIPLTQFKSEDILFSLAPTFIGVFFAFSLSGVILFGAMLSGNKK